MQEDNFDNGIENEEDLEMDVYTLTDEDGKESDFELIGRIDADGQSYVALAPIDFDSELDSENEDEEDGGFVVLKVVEEDGEEVFVTIDDDEEFDRIADIFEDELFQDMDYDEEDEEDGDDEENEDE